jgi:hypothetical protein
MSNEKKGQGKTPDPKTLAGWWQEAEEQIKLAHPQESQVTREKLVMKYVESRIKKYHASQQIDEPHPDEKLIAEWYQNELLKLREAYPDRPLRKREREAASVVAEKIKPLNLL